MSDDEEDFKSDDDAEESDDYVVSDEDEGDDEDGTRPQKRSRKASQVCHPFQSHIIPPNIESSHPAISTDSPGRRR